MLLFTTQQQNWYGLPQYLSANGEQVFHQHEFWRLWTTSLLHSNLGHLLANSVFFTGLAFLLYGYFGYWIFPVLSFFMGGIINLFTLAIYPSSITLVGASGIVYFMASFWLTLYVSLDRGISIYRRIANATAFTLILLIPETIKPEVSYLCHLIGFLIGIPCGLAFFYFRRSWLRSFEVWNDPDENSEDAEMPTVQMIS